MKRVIKIKSVIAFCAAACAIIMALAAPARAADPVFPVGSRLGLVPPSGMLPSKEFPGFEDPDEKAAILFAMLPAAAFDSFEKTVAPEALKKLGIDLENREPMTLAGGGKGFVLSGKQTTYKGQYRKWILVALIDDVTAVVTVQTPGDDTKYSDKAMHDMLATLVLRASVPDPERLSLLPFTVGDFSGFHVDDVLPGNALMLAGGYPGEADKPPSNGAANVAHFIIAAMQGGPNEPADRDNFARVTFGQIGGITDVRIQDSEPLRISNQSGYQTLAKAKEGQTGTDIMVVQWLRFGSGGYLQMIGVARADGWPETLTRLRTVRDSIEVK